MFNFGASKPRVKGGPGGPDPLDPHLVFSTKIEKSWSVYCSVYHRMAMGSNVIYLDILQLLRSWKPSLTNEILYFHATDPMVKRGSKKSCIKPLRMS